MKEFLLELKQHIWERWYTFRYPPKKLEDFKLRAIIECPEDIENDPLWKGE